MKPILLSSLSLFAILLTAQAAEQNPDAIANINTLIERNAPEGTISWDKELKLEAGKIGLPAFDDEGRRKTQAMPKVQIVNFAGHTKKLATLKTELEAFKKKCDVGLKFWSTPEGCGDYASKLKQKENEIFGLEREINNIAATCDLGVPSDSSTVIVPAGKAHYKTTSVKSFSKRFGPNEMPEITLTLKTDKGERKGVLSCSFGWTDWAEAQEELGKAGFKITPDKKVAAKPAAPEYLHLEGSPAHNDDDSEKTGNSSAE